SPTIFFTLSLHDALPIYLDKVYARESVRVEDKLRRFVERNPNTWVVAADVPLAAEQLGPVVKQKLALLDSPPLADAVRKDYAERSEEHTSELQSRFDLVC